MQPSFALKTDRLYEREQQQKDWSFLTIDNEYFDEIIQEAQNQLREINQTLSENSNVEYIRRDILKEAQESGQGLIFTHNINTTLFQNLSSSDKDDESERRKRLGIIRQAQLVSQTSFSTIGDLYTNEVNHQYQLIRDSSQAYSIPSLVGILKYPLALATTGTTLYITIQNISILQPLLGKTIYDSLVENSIFILMTVYKTTITIAEDIEGYVYYDQPFDALTRNIIAELSKSGIQSLRLIGRGALVVGMGSTLPGIIGSVVLNMTLNTATSKIDSFITMNIRYRDQHSARRAMAELALKRQEEYEKEKRDAEIRLRKREGRPPSLSTYVDNIYSAVKYNSQLGIFAGLYVIQQYYVEGILDTLGMMTFTPMVKNINLLPTIKYLIERTWFMPLTDVVFTKLRKRPSKDWYYTTAGIHMVLTILQNATPFFLRVDNFLQIYDSYDDVGRVLMARANLLLERLFMAEKWNTILSGDWLNDITIDNITFLRPGDILYGNDYKRQGSVVHYKNDPNFYAKLDNGDDLLLDFATGKEFYIQRKGIMVRPDVVEHSTLTAENVSPHLIEQVITLGFPITKLESIQKSIRDFQKDIEIMNRSLLTAQSRLQNLIIHVEERKELLEQVDNALSLSNWKSQRELLSFIPGIDNFRHMNRELFLSTSSLLRAELYEKYVNTSKTKTILSQEINVLSNNISNSQQKIDQTTSQLVEKLNQFKANQKFVPGDYDFNFVSEKRILESSYIPPIPYDSGTWLGDIRYLPHSLREGTVLTSISQFQDSYQGMLREAEKMGGYEGQERIKLVQSLRNKLLFTTPEIPLFLSSDITLLQQLLEEYKRNLSKTLSEILNVEQEKLMGCFSTRERVLDWSSEQKRIIAVDPYTNQIDEYYTKNCLQETYGATLYNTVTRFFTHLVSLLSGGGYLLKFLRGIGLSALDPQTLIEDYFIWDLYDEKPLEGQSSLTNSLYYFFLSFLAARDTKRSYDLYGDRVVEFMYTDTYEYLKLAGQADLKETMGDIISVINMFEEDQEGIFETIYTYLSAISTIIDRMSTILTNNKIASVLLFGSHNTSTVYRRWEEVSLELEKSQLTLVEWWNERQSSILEMFGM